LMSSPDGVFGLLVEALALPRSTATLEPLPLLVASPLFSNIVVQNDMPVLILNIENIGQMIYQTAV
jgi:hypothetical protein